MTINLHYVRDDTNSHAKKLIRYIHVRDTMTDHKGLAIIKDNGAVICDSDLPNYKRGTELLLQDCRWGIVDGRDTFDILCPAFGDDDMDTKDQRMLIKGAVNNFDSDLNDQAHTIVKMLKACYAKKVTIELVFQRNGKRLKDPITGNYTRVYVYKAGYGIYGSFLGYYLGTLIKSASDVRQCDSRDYPDEVIQKIIYEQLLLGYRLVVGRM